MLRPQETPPRAAGPKYQPQRQFPHGKQLKPSPRKRPSAPRLHADMKTQKKAAPTSRCLPPLYSPRARRKMMDPAQGNQGTFLSAIPADLSRTKVSLHQPSRLQTKENRRFFLSGPSKETHKGRRPSGTRRSTPPKPSAGWSQVHDPGRAGTQAAQQGQDKT